MGINRILIVNIAVFCCQDKRGLLGWGLNSKIRVPVEQIKTFFLNGLGIIHGIRNFRS